MDHDNVIPNNDNANINLESLKDNILNILKEKYKGEMRKNFTKITPPALKPKISEKPCPKWGEYKWTLFAN